MDFAFGDGDAVKDGEGAPENFGVESRTFEELTNLAIRATVGMPVVVMMPVVVVVVGVSMAVNIEFRASDVLLGTLEKMEVDFVAESEGCDGVVEDAFRNADIAKGTDGHVATDAGKTIEVENSHIEDLSCNTGGEKTKRVQRCVWARRNGERQSRMAVVAMGLERNPSIPASRHSSW